MAIVSKEVADDFVEALRKLEEDRDVEALVKIHTEDCEVGNVSVSETFRGHDDLREFWIEYRRTFGEIKSTFRNVFATEEGGARMEDRGHLERRHRLLRWREHPRDWRWQGPPLHGVLRHP